MREKRRKVTRGRLTKSSCIHKSKDETRDESRYFFDLGVYPNPVRNGSYEDLATKIFNSSEFSQVFSEDRCVFGDRVETFLRQVVETCYSDSTRVDRDRVVTIIRAYLRILVDDQDRDSDYYDGYKDIILKQVYFNTHDCFNRIY